MRSKGCKRTAYQRVGPLADMGSIDYRKQDPSFLGRGLERLTSSDDRWKTLQILDMGIADGTQMIELARLKDMGLTTLERLRRQLNSDWGNIKDRTDTHHHVDQPLRNEEHLQIQLTCKEPEFAALPARADGAKPRRWRFIN